MYISSIQVTKSNIDDLVSPQWFPEFMLSRMYTKCFVIYLHLFIREHVLCVLGEIVIFLIKHYNNFVNINSLVNLSWRFRYFMCTQVGTAML